MAQPTPPDYRRASLQRLAAAEHLLASDAFRLEGMYLAGYAVECALKALIVARTPKARRATVRSRGEAGHDFEALALRLRRLGCTIPASVAGAMRPILTWSTGLRYEAGRRSRDEAVGFVGAARSIVEWAERSL